MVNRVRHYGRGTGHAPRSPGLEAIIGLHLTKRGARVIIARQDVVPVEIVNPHLFVSKPKTAPDSSESLPIAVASNSNKTAATAQAPLISNVGMQETAESQAAGSAPSGTVPQKAAPISVFVSRKLSRLFVRQGFTPLFDVPVNIQKSGGAAGNARIYRHGT